MWMTYLHVITFTFTIYLCDAKAYTVAHRHRCISAYAFDAMLSDDDVLFSFCFFSFILSFAYFTDNYRHRRRWRRLCVYVFVLYICLHAGVHTICLSALITIFSGSSTHSMAWRKHWTLIVCMCFCSSSSACALDGFSGSLELIVTIYSLAAHTFLPTLPEPHLVSVVQNVSLNRSRSFGAFFVLSTKLWNATLGRFVLMKDVSKAACIPVSRHPNLFCVHSAGTLLNSSEDWNSFRQTKHSGIQIEYSDWDWVCARGFHSSCADTLSWVWMRRVYSRQASNAYNKIQLHSIEFNDDTKLIECVQFIPTSDAVALWCAKCVPFQWIASIALLT